MHVFYLKARAVQNYGCSCMMNKYLQAEMTLGLEYLNAVTFNIMIDIF